MENKRGNKLFAGFVFGFLFGSIAAFLLRTKEGKKTLHHLQVRSKKNLEDIKKMLMHEVDEEITPLVEIKPEHERKLPRIVNRRKKK